MATVNPETQAHAAAGLSFLSLPPEVRNMIYRLLLVADRPLGCFTKETDDTRFCNCHSKIKWASLGEYHIQPAVLRVCSQLYREASPILNGENTFGISIRPVALDDNEVRMSSFRCSEITDGRSTFWDSSMEKFQRFQILIGEAQYFEVKSGVAELCRCFLNKSHAMQHVSIHLYNTFEDDYKVLGLFGSLRNLRSVKIYGVPRRYAKQLKQLMLGNTASGNLYGMYHMLKKYVKDLNGDHSDLQKASEAMRKCDVQKFQAIQSKILLDGRDRFARASRQLFDFDPESEKDH